MAKQAVLCLFMAFILGTVMACAPGELEGRLGLRGHDGSTVVGPQGPQGSPGIQGPSGAQGLIGLPGQDGTMITIVQFCPGTPVYPSTFLEVGECISGKLYGVYSANDGFLAYLPNGQYTSNAIGSTCNFTITGCTISY